MVADQLANGHSCNPSWFSNFPIDVVTKVCFNLYDLKDPAGSLCFRKKKHGK